MARSCWDTALGLLAGRAHTRRELTDKLRQRKFNTKEIEETIERAKDLRLMEDDQPIAQRHAEELRKKKGATPRWAEGKLLTRGVESSTAAEAVKAAFEGWDEEASAMAFARGETDSRRAARRLDRKGYSSAAIAHVVRQMAQSGSDRDED